MAIYNVAAEWTDSNGREWLGVWKRRAVSQNAAINRAKEDLARIDGDWKRIRTGACMYQTGVSVIGKSGRIMAIERGGLQAGIAIRFNDNVRVTTVLTETERAFVWGRVWDL